MVLVGVVRACYGALDGKVLCDQTRIRLESGGLLMFPVINGTSCKLEATEANHGIYLQCALRGCAADQCTIARCARLAGITGNLFHVRIVDNVLRVSPTAAIRRRAK